MPLDTLSFGFQSSGSGGGGTDENLGNTNLTNSATERRYILSDNDLKFDNDGSDILKLSAQESEVTIGGTGASSVFFKSGTSAPDIRIFEASGSGGNYIKLTCGALASNTTLTLPNTTGTIALTSDITANTNLGTTNLALDSGTPERQYVLTDNDLVFNNGSGSDCLKISAQEGEVTLGGSGTSSVFFKSGTSAPDIRIFEASGSGNNYIKLTCGALASNTTLTLPNTTGTLALTSDITANTNLGTTDLSLDSGTAERTYTLTDNDLHFKNNGSSCLKISAQEGELTLGGAGTSSVFFKSGTSAPDIRIFEASGSGTNYVKLTLGALSSNQTITIPDATGTLPLLESDQTFTGQQNIEKRKLITTGATDGDVDGDVVYFGSTSVNVGRLYYWDGTDWQNADADAASTSTGMLGIALATGTASSVGICIRGMITLSSSTGGSNGDILYVHTTANKITSTAPSGSGDIVRIVGYLLDATNDAIYFNPDGSFVEIA